MKTRKHRVLFVDGSSGASGDMILGALVDLGVPLSRIRKALKSLPIKGWTLRSRRVSPNSLSGRKIDVRVDPGERGRGWTALRRIVRAGDLDPGVQRRCLAVFRRLIDAEARVHGMDADKIHLHEAGATDAIVDVVGACVGIEHLGLDRIVVSRLTTGSGSVRCAHGVYPVPGPATLELVRGVPVRSGSIEIERLTPTGAAILTSVADEWSPMPPMTPLAVGYGAGDHDLGDTPNLLRMILGETDATERNLPGDEVLVLECTVDDSTPQALAYAAHRLLEAGALDSFVTPVVMKKGRPGHTLTALARERDLDPLARVMLSETTSLGVRFRLERRIELERTSSRVKTAFGTIRVKVARRGDEILQVWPEYEDCAKAARRHAVPLHEVQQSALLAYRSSATGG